MIAFTRFTNASGKPLSKTIRLGADAQPVTTVAAHMVAGSFERVEVEHIDDFSDLLADGKYGVSHANSYGITEAASGLVASQDRIRKGSARRGAIARTASNFRFREGQPGIMFLDFDAEAGEHLDPFALDRTLCAAAPWLKPVRRFYIPSASSRVFAGDRLISSKTSWHAHFVVDDAARIPAVGNEIHIRLIEAGRGCIFISTGDTGAADTWRPA